MANACYYFRNLLEGPFKESTQYAIEINLGTAFSFEAFKCVIDYANKGIFYRDPDNCHPYIDAIQLAISWGYDEFVALAEDHLIDRGLTRDEIDVLTRLAGDNLPTLKRLYDACEEFATSMARRDFIRISRCIIDNHIHAYLDCDGKLEEKPNDWEESAVTTPKEEDAYHDLKKKRRSGLIIRNGATSVSK